MPEGPDRVRESRDNSMPKDQYIWVFNGANWQLPGGVFSARSLANRWIFLNKLSGLLTAYPLDIGVYDWAVREGILEGEKAPDFIARFSHATLEHYHYENGECPEDDNIIPQTINKDDLEIQSSLLFIWVFTGEEYPLPSGIFSTREKAEAWVGEHLLTGSLTAYPIDISIYDWAIMKDLFRPQSESEKTPLFIQQFTFAGQERYLYMNGQGRNKLGLGQTNCS